LTLDRAGPVLLLNGLDKGIMNNVLFDRDERMSWSWIWIHRFLLF
jgi:hypothetical protein